MTFDSRLLLFPVALASAVAPAQAETFRNPKVGVPAFNVELLPGWSANYDDSDNLLLINGDKQVAMTFSVVDNDPKNPFTSVDLAQALFQVLGSPPYDRTETGMVDGQRADIYIGSFTRDDGLELELRVVVIKLGPKYAVASIITPTGADGSYVKQGHDQLAKARIIRK
ncbi:hypothetical protein [Novosphingobium sp.]|uniref:hypothetical protein n=1 Tax=Novosphingobium sp. TaxID=1874826 RepID=UPI0035B1265E